MTAPPPPGFPQAGPDVDVADVQRNFENRLRDVQERAATLKQQMAANVVEKSSPDGAVKITVTATGSISNVFFGPKATSLSTVKLAEAFMKTYREATREASKRTVELVSDFAGEDSPAVDQIKQTLPDEDGENQ